jgi:hypothetical protein
LPRPVSDLEGDFGPLPLGRVFGEIEVGVFDEPHDPFARNEVRYLLLGVMNVLVTVGELGAELVGAALDLS